MGFRLSATSALLVLLGLMGCLWAVLAYEVAFHRVDTMTLALALSFTAMMIAWPFVNGMRLTPKGPTQMAVCRECRQFLIPAFSFGFCPHCGAAAVKPVRRSA